MILSSKLPYYLFSRSGVIKGMKDRRDRTILYFYASVDLVAVHNITLSQPYSTDFNQQP